jgi:hypothetical protein
MSTLRCTNLQDTSGSNSLTTAQIYNGAAKAWVNFNGTGTVAIRAQFNVSSITDDGTGDYRVNFSTAMPDANYGAGLGSGDVNLGGNWDYTLNTYQVTTSLIRVRAVNPSGSRVDSTFVSVAIFR